MARARDLMTEALREALRSRRISPTKASKTAGLYNDALSAAFRGARCLALDEIDEVLAANDIPFEELLSYMAAASRPLQKPPDPVAIVASMRDQPRPHYPDLQIWLTLVPVVGSGEAPKSLPPLVEEIEEIFARDRSEALERTRIWVSTFRNRLRGASRGQRFRATAVCEFAIALGMWGVVACCLGLTNDAAFALEHALRLHRAFPLSRGYARLLHWSTLLALPAGNPQCGATLAEQALLILACLGETKSEASVLVALAAMKGYSGLELHAAQIAQTIIEHPRASADNRFSAYLLKVQAALLKKDVYAARDDLAAAQQLLPSLPSHRTAYWSWWDGRIQAANRNFMTATRVFSKLLEVDSPVLEANDRFLIFIDLAETLKEVGDFETLKVEAKKMHRWLPLLDVSTFNRAIVVAFACTTQQRWPEGKELEEVRAAMKKGVEGTPFKPNLPISSIQSESE